VGYYKGIYVLNYNTQPFQMSRRYTKSNLEEIVSVQLENLNAMHDLLSIMKHQNGLLNSANKKLKDEITDFKQKLYPTRKEIPKSEGRRISSLYQSRRVGAMCLFVCRVFKLHTTYLYPYQKYGIYTESVYNQHLWVAFIS